MADLGVRLKYYERYMTFPNQKDFATILGIAESTYSGYVSRNNPRTPDYGDIVKYADIMCVSLDWLVGRGAEPMWSPLVMDLRAELRRQAPEIPETNTTVMDRMVAVIRWCQEFKPLDLPNTRPWFLPQLLGYAPEDLRVLIEQKRGPLQSLLKRLARFTALDSQWLQVGKPEFLAPVLAGEYARVVQKARHLQIPPEQLEAEMPDLPLVFTEQRTNPVT